MRMMQVAADEIIGMAAVRYRVMSAARAMGVLTVVRSARMCRSTSGWIRAILRQGMFIHMSLMGTVKMSFMQIIDVTFVFDRGVTAA